MQCVLRLVHFTSEDGAVTVDLDRRTTCRRPLLLCDFSPAIPCRALQNLGQGQLVGCYAQSFPDRSGQTVPKER